MKKISLVLMVLLVSSAIVFAQNTGIDSVVSDASSGLFTNALDDAANVGGGFDELDGSYLFAGVANLEKTGDNNNWQWFDNGGGGADDNNPMWMGFYRGGDSPWSLFLGFDAEDSAGNQADDTVYSTTTDTVTSGTTTTTHYWNDQVDETTYTGNRFLNEFNAAVQFLTMFGGINTGLYFDFYVNDDTPQANNYELTQDYFYNPVQGTNVAPAPLADYSFARTETLINKDTTIVIGVPLYLETGDMSHSVNITADIMKSDDSNSDEQTYSGTPQGAMAVANIEYEEVSTATTIDFDADYDLAMAGLFGNHEDNKLKIGVDFGVEVEIPEYSETDITQNVTYAGAGAAAVTAARDEDNVDVTFENGMNLNVELSAGHSFYYDFGPAMFAFDPQLTFAYNKDTETQIASLTIVDRTDGDADGAFTTAADTIQTTETTYSNTDSGMGDLDVVTTLRTTFTLPVAVKVNPADWPFSVTVGSEPRLVLTNTITEVTASTNTSNTTLVTGAGTTTGTAVSNADSENVSKDVENALWVGADHNIGLSLPVGDAVSLDVNLGLSTGANNILDFKDMVIQAIVRLP